VSERERERERERESQPTEGLSKRRRGQPVVRDAREQPYERLRQSHFIDCGEGEKRTEDEQNFEGASHTNGLPLDRKLFFVDGREKEKDDYALNALVT
jgi:hypothetical protein